MAVTEDEVLIYRSLLGESPRHVLVEGTIAGERGIFVCAVLHRRDNVAAGLTAVGVRPMFKLLSPEEVDLVDLGGETASSEEEAEELCQKAVKPKKTDLHYWFSRYPWKSLILGF